MRIAGLFVVLVAGVTQSHPLLAQQELASVDLPVSAQYQGQSRAGNLDRRISISVSKVTLEQFVARITAATGVAFDYPAGLFPAGKTVSVSVTEMSARDVLAKALRPHGVVLGAESPGHAALVKAQTSAVQDGVITGKVIHAKTKQPVSGVNITIDGSKQEVVTGSDGTFRISATAGTRTISARSIGFVRQSQTITVPSGETIQVEFVLEPSASVLDEVVVTGTVVATERKAITTPITVITAEEIERRGITRIEQFFRGEVPGVLALELGSEIYGDGMPEYEMNFGAAVSSKVYTRGASGFSSMAGDDRGTPTPLKTYVDGVEILNPTYLGTIDPQSIERIEIITGPQAATIYGSGAMGGVMQIFTKRGRSQAGTEFSLSLRQGFLQNNLSSGLTPKHSHSFNMRGGTGAEWTYAANASYNYTGQWRPGLWMRNMGASLGLTHNRGNLTVSGSFSVTNGKNGSAAAEGAGPSPIGIHNLSTGEWVLPGTQFNIATYMLRIVGTSAAHTASLNLSYKQSARFQHSVTVGRSQNTFGIQSTRPRFSLPRDSVWTTGASSGQRTTGSYHITANFSPDDWFSSVITAGGNGSSGSQINVSGCTAARSSSTYLDECTSVARGIDDRNIGGFASWRVGLAQSLYLSLGLRAEHNPAYGNRVKVDWTPTNGVAYTLEHGDISIKLLGSYGQATRAPASHMRRLIETTNSNREPMTYVSQLAAPDLTAEYSRGPQGGLEVYYGSLGSVTVNRYRQTITDLIQNVIVDSVELLVLSNGNLTWRDQRQYRNVAKIRQHGWELSGALNILRLQVRGTYSWNDSRILSVNPTGSGHTELYSGMSFQQVPTHFGNLSMSYAHGQATVTVSSNYVGQSLQDGGDGMISLGYDLTRIRAYYPVTRRVFVELAKPGYVKSDLSVQYQLTPSAIATINVINLENSTASDLPFYTPSLGRQTTIGFVLRRR